MLYEHVKPYFVLLLFVCFVLCCVCAHPDSKLRVFGKTCALRSCRSRGMPGNSAVGIQTKTLQFSCDMECGRGFHVAAFSEWHQAKPRTCQ